MHHISIKAKISLALMLLILLSAITRQLLNGEQNMSLISGGQITIGGEQAPILTTLRALLNDKKQGDKSLSQGDIDRYLPPSRHYRPRTPILLSRHEVTNLQYRRFLNFTSSRKEQLKLYTHSSIAEDHRFRPNTLNDVKYASFNQPIINVSWQDSYAFCRFSNMRLPSSYEFEQAFRFELSLRQGDEFDYPQIANPTDSEPNPEQNPTQIKAPKPALKEEILPTIVGSYFTTNGIFQDIIGNAIEWVQPLPQGHLLMGYSFKQYGKDNNIKTFHPYKRHFADPNDASNDYGFRCAYQPTRAQWQWLQTRPTTINRDGTMCWNTRNNLSGNGLNLITPHNQIFQAAGQLFPNEMCLIPTSDEQLGPPQDLTTISLLRQNPLSYSAYLLGVEPKATFVKPFWLDQQEVSVAQFKQFLELPQIQQDLHQHPEASEHLTKVEPLNWQEQQQHPSKTLVGINWYQAFAYCSWQNKRLPFENEWQAALKGNDNRLYPWGNNPKQSNQADLTPDGLQGMSKTISEWTATFVIGSDSAIVKGGSALFDWTIFGRAYTQVKVPRHSQSPQIGFRCAKSQ